MPTECSGKEIQWYIALDFDERDGFNSCLFTSFSTVIKSFQEDGSVIGCVQYS